MINKFIDILFKSDMIREAIFTEVNFYNTVSRITKDPESMKTASAFWDEGDGWRGWSIEGDKYYFNDFPEHDLLGAMLVIEDMAGING